MGGWVVISDLFFVVKKKLLLVNLVNRGRKFRNELIFLDFFEILFRFGSFF